MKCACDRLSAARTHRAVTVLNHVERYGIGLQDVEGDRALGSETAGPVVHDLRVRCPGSQIAPNVQRTITPTCARGSHLPASHAEADEDRQTTGRGRGYVSRRGTLPLRGAPRAVQTLPNKLRLQAVRPQNSPSPCAPPFAPRARQVLLILSVMLGPASVCADGNLDLPASLQRGITLERSDRGMLSVRRAGVQAPLLRVPIFGVDVNPQGTQIEVLPDTCWYFGEPLVRTFTLDMLEARIANAAALKLHRERRHAEAAPGFRKALQLDPNYLLAAVNLASALTLAGNKDAAVAALAPFFARELPRVYLAVLQDPELQPLLSMPVLAALRTQQPGTAVLRERDRRWIAHSPRHHLLASLDEHSGLVIFSLSSGAWVAQLDMGSEIFPSSCGDTPCHLWVDKERLKVKRQARELFQRQEALANRFLADLGFNAVMEREDANAKCPAAQKDEPGSGNTLCLQRNGLQFSLAERDVHLHGNNKDLVWANCCPSADRIEAATYLPQLGAIVFQWRKGHGSTECGRQAGTDLVLLSSGTKVSAPQSLQPSRNTKLPSVAP